MFSFARRILPALLALSTVAGYAQQSAKTFYANHRPDFFVGGTGLFTRDLTPQNANQMFNANAAGFLFTMRDHLVGTDLEINYGYSRYRQRFAPAGGPMLDIKPSVHEGTAALLIHPRVFRLSPFVGIGGGTLDFMSFREPNSPGQEQWRGTGLFEVGFDVPTSSKHVGFRLQGRSLIYRAPNYNMPSVTTGAWVATAEPSVGVWMKF